MQADEEVVRREGDELLPGNVRIIRLPGYSPELNPIEKLCKLLEVSPQPCHRPRQDYGV